MGCAVGRALSTGHRGRRQSSTLPGIPCTSHYAPRTQGTRLPHLLAIVTAQHGRRSGIAPDGRGVDTHHKLPPRRGILTQRISDGADRFRPRARVGEVGVDGAVLGHYVRPQPHGKVRVGEQVEDFQSGGGRGRGWGVGYPGASTMAFLRRRVRLRGCREAAGHGSAAHAAAAGSSSSGSTSSTSSTSTGTRTKVAPKSRIRGDAGVREFGRHEGRGAALSTPVGGEGTPLTAGVVGEDHFGGRIRRGCRRAKVKRRNESV